MAAVFILGGVITIGVSVRADELTMKFDMNEVVHQILNSAPRPTPLQTNSITPNSIRPEIHYVGGTKQ
eukprot:2600206-Amphidinium_carterae.1